MKKRRRWGEGLWAGWIFVVVVYAVGSEEEEEPLSSENVGGRLKVRLAAV
jgi:hypothetical protein